MPRLKASLHGKFARLAHMLHVFWKTRYHARVLAIARYEEAREEIMENMDTPDDETLPPVTLPQPYEETREDDLWSELIREHEKASDAETFAGIKALYRSYQAISWPKAVKDSCYPAFIPMIVFKQDVGCFVVTAASCTGQLFSI